MCPPSKRKKGVVVVVVVGGGSILLSQSIKYLTILLSEDFLHTENALTVTLKRKMT